MDGINNGFLNAALISVDVGSVQSLNLAYIGDAVFEVLVRSKIIASSNSKVNTLHKQSTGIVKATAQCEMYYKIKDLLSEEEADVLNRGKNAKSHHKAKNASLKEYRYATGVEALFGYLYLKGENERLMEIFNICVEK